ncbi:hypothetical protein AB0K48_40155, partial [Nonomuraea sp. NPDC055795]
VLREGRVVHTGPLAGLGRVRLVSLMMGRPFHPTGLPSTALRMALDAGFVAVVPRFVAARSVRDGGTALLPLGFGGWRVDVQFVYASATADRLGVRTLLDRLPAIRATFDQD